MWTHHTEASAKLTRVANGVGRGPKTLAINPGTDPDQVEAQNKLAEKFSDLEKQINNNDDAIWAKLEKLMHHTPSIDKTEREEGVYYPEKIAEQWGECCDKCHDVTFDKTYPAHTAYHACMSLKCDCHKPKEPIKDWKPIFTNALHEYEEEGANDTTFLFSEVERIIEQIRQEERETRPSNRLCG